MMPELIEDVVRLAIDVGYVMVATVGIDGMPHIASASNLMQKDADHFLVREWFCPRTVLNLEQNKFISVVVWEADADIGYQLTGEVETIENLAIVDGYEETETDLSPPQVERNLVIRLIQVVKFSQKPHSDMPLSG